MVNRNLARLGLTAFMALAAAACSGEAMAGGQRDVDVNATGDGGGGTAPALLPAGRAASTTLASSVQGTVQFAAAVRLVSGGAAVPVGSAGTVTLRADGADTLAVVRGRVPATTYATARIVFRQASASVTGGLLIDGVSFTGTATVDIPAGDSLVVERTVSIGPGEGDIHLLLDLNASSWLAATNRVTRSVSATAFRNAVQVEVR